MGISIKTVKVHRARVMEKLEVIPLPCWFTVVIFQKFRILRQPTDRLKTIPFP
jgi:hypothetical protein